MEKKNKGQTQAIQWTEKTKDKHRQYNGQKRKRTKTANTMDRKEKHKHRRRIGQKRQRTNIGDTMDKKEKGQTQATKLYRLCLSFCLFCPLCCLCLSFVFFVHCMAYVCPFPFLHIV
jgi:hypothetical protein